MRAARAWCLPALHTAIVDDGSDTACHDAARDIVDDGGDTARDAFIDDDHDDTGAKLDHDNCAGAVRKQQHDDDDEDELTAECRPG